MYTVVSIYSHIYIYRLSKWYRLPNHSYHYGWTLSNRFNKKKTSCQRRKRSLHFKDNYLILIVSHRHLNSVMCSVLFRRLCRAQEEPNSRTDELNYCTDFTTMCMSSHTPNSFHVCVLPPCPPSLLNPSTPRLSPHLPFDPFPFSNGQDRLYGCFRGNRPVNSDQRCMF